MWQIDRKRALLTRKSYTDIRLKENKEKDKSKRFHHRRRDDTTTTINVKSRNPDLCYTRNVGLAWYMSANLILLRSKSICSSHRVSHLSFLTVAKLGLHESETIQYFCNFCFALGNSWKFISCLGLISQYEKYYCLVLKFLIILWSYADRVRQKASRLFKKLEVHVV